MTDYLTLTEFIPGTKAKAQEINANFATVKDAINSKAAAEGDSTKTFNVANALTAQQAVNKAQLDSATTASDKKAEGLINRFCILAGNLTNGESDILSFSSTTLTFKIGGSYPETIWRASNGTQETITTLANITGLSNNGTYTVLKELGATNAIATSSKVTQGKTFPAAPIDGDYHCLTSTCIKTYKRLSGAWIETQYIQLGTATVTNSVISAVSTTPYNQNGYDFNIQTTSAYITKIYKNGENWYRLWSDGYIEQGGLVYYNTAMQTVSLLYPFKSTDYSVRTQRLSDGQSFEQPITARDKTYFKFGSVAGGGNYQWTAKGY